MGAPQVFEVHPRVWCVRRPLYLSCSYLVLQPDCVILVDTGMHVRGSDMLFGLQRAGRKPSDVGAILLTHWHNDHSGGAQALQQLTGAPVHHSEREVANFTRSTPRTLLHRISDRVPEIGPLGMLRGILGESPTRPVHAKSFAREGDVLAGGFEVLETPGHSPGHLSFWLPAERALFSGDALAVCSNRLAYMSRLLTHDPEQARASMRRCLELPARLICPGHRAPLAEHVEEERARALREIDSSRAWPLFS